jgi:hypothetical protein
MMRAPDLARSADLQPTVSTIGMVTVTLVLNGVAGCATAPSAAVDGCGVGRAPATQKPPNPAEQVLSRTTSRAVGMGGSEAGRAVRVTDNRYVDTLLSGAVRDSVTAARRAWGDAAEEGDTTVRYRVVLGVTPGSGQAIQVSSPLINDAPWRIEVPRTGALSTTHAPVTRGGHDVTTVVKVGARRTDATALVVASCRYLEGLGNRATLQTGRP